MLGSISIDPIEISHRAEYDTMLKCRKNLLGKVIREINIWAHRAQCMEI